MTLTFQEEITGTDLMIVEVLGDACPSVTETFRQVARVDFETYPFVCNAKLGNGTCVYVPLDFCRCISTSSTTTLDLFTFETNPFGWILARWMGVTHCMV
jgi:hypothetical protein